MELHSILAFTLVAAIAIAIAILGARQLFKKSPILAQDVQADGTTSKPSRSKLYKSAFPSALPRPH